jgi:hypothetical protein
MPLIRMNGMSKTDECKTPYFLEDWSVMLDDLAQFNKDLIALRSDLERLGVIKPKG